MARETSVRLAAVGALALGVALGALGACASDGDEAPAAKANRVSAADEIRAGRSGAPDASNAAVRIFVTGDTHGFLGPCGCDDAQYGGIARRGSYLGAIGRADDLRIDLGNAAAGTGALRDLRLRTTLEALERMRYDVFVPGPDDLAVADRIPTARGGGVVRICSANVVRTDGTPAFEPWFVRELADGRRIGVLGVTGESEVVAEGFRVEAPVTVRAALSRLRKQVDAVVVAAAMPADEAERLATGLEGVAVVLAGGVPVDRMAAMSMTGHASKDADEAFRGSEPPVAVAGDFAAYVRRVDLGADLRPTGTWRSWLGEDVADDPDVAAFYKRFRAEMATLDPDLIPDILKGLDARGFAGSAACAECHQADHEAWSKSLHALGMPTLVGKDSARDADCVPCHLVDVKEGAATDLSVADTLGIGCEACHAGRAKHIELARAGRLDEERPPPYSAREVCTGCHHPPEVKSFDFDVLWPRIEHGD